MERIFLLAFVCLLVPFFACSQSQTPGVEGLIVEEYYRADKQEGALPAGSVTYRIFVDMADGYELQAVFGNEKHDLKISTTTRFFNDSLYGGTQASMVHYKRLDEGNAALDSWLTIGTGAQSLWGILLKEDAEGSSYVKNKAKLSVKDGLMNGSLPTMISFGLDLSTFDKTDTSGTFKTNNGTWAVGSKTVGPTASNTVLIAQLTTNGDLHLELNVQVRDPYGNPEVYVAKNPQRGEFQIDDFTYDSKH